MRVPFPSPQDGAQRGDHEGIGGGYTVSPAVSGGSPAASSARTSSGTPQPL